MTNYDSRPLLFISYRHADRQIADVLRRFLSSRSLGKISVFQSSSVGDTLEIGEKINQQLMEKLDKANPIVLLYTTTDQDWSYCMRECGIATNPASPHNTRIIVFQCATGFFPALFADRVRVNIQNKEDLQKLTKDFLTDPCFFPELSQAIAPDIEPNGSEVRDATEELYQKFQEVIPPLPEPPEEWSAWPFLQFEISLEHAECICKTQPEQRFQVASAVIQEFCLMVVQAIEKHNGYLV
ncbi:TIR domain-containing protein [Nostoc sp.]|uniref:TIR domain-containing protein n=1 Tax=Nostoc sp. TaxID=1180 RepID=UPI003593B826